MTVRLMLVSPAVSTATARACFEDGHPLTPAGLRRAREAAGTVPSHPDAAGLGSGPGAVLVSGTKRCVQTAEALGLRAHPVPELDGWSVGAWRGRSLAEVAGAEPEAVAAWLRDPHFAPPGGESLTELCSRVRDWLMEPDGAAARTGQGTDAGPGAGAGSGSSASRIVAVVEPDVVRAALVVALDVPYEVFWRLDIRPLTATVLSGQQRRSPTAARSWEGPSHGSSGTAGGRWNVQIGAPLISHAGPEPATDIE